MDFANFKILIATILCKFRDQQIKLIATVVIGEFELDEIGQMSKRTLKNKFKIKWILAQIRQGSTN